MFCPKCRTEYRKGFATCADCNVPLVGELPPHTPEQLKDLERKNMVRVATTKKGQELYKQSNKRESIHRIMAALSEEECQQLIGCLTRLHTAALKEIGVDHEIPFLSNNYGG